MIFAQLRAELKIHRLKEFNVNLVRGEVTLVSLCGRKSPCGWQQVLLPIGRHCKNCERCFKALNRESTQNVIDE